MASLPDYQMVKGYRTKSILRDAYRYLLPQEVIKAPKRGFEIPLVALLNHELRPMLMDTVGSPHPHIGKYFSTDFLRKLLDQKIMMNRNRGYIVYALLVLELWLQMERNRLSPSLHIS